jgi:hypothetical protein
MTYEERQDAQGLRLAEKALDASRKMYEASGSYAALCRLEAAEARYERLASRALLPA